MDRTKPHRTPPGPSRAYTASRKTVRITHRFGPRLEGLEDRVQPGDTLLGLLAMALSVVGSFSLNTSVAFDSGASFPGGAQDLFSDCPALGGADADRLPSDFSSHEAGAFQSAVGLKPELEHRFILPTFPEDATDAGPMDGCQLLALPLRFSATPPTDGGGAAPWLQGTPFFPLSIPEFGNSARPLVEMSAHTFAAFSILDSGKLSFDAGVGQLTIRPDGAANMVHAAAAADGFVDVTVNGKSYSSNPEMANYDTALKGATRSSLSEIRFDGAGQGNTLVLDSQSLPHGLAVLAPEAQVVTEDVAIGGSLTIMAQSITVQGTLQSQAAALNASSWLDVQAGGGRIVSTKGAVGGQIGLTADVLVNSGQLHADGDSGGQVLVQSRNFLNAGLITADGTSVGGDGGLVHLGFTDSYIATKAASTSANGAHGGLVVLDGEVSGHLFSSGRQLATGSAHGGTVDLLGRDIVLAGASVDASGETGGTIQIGSAFQSLPLAMSGAQSVTVTAATMLRADAGNTGDGGRIIVWSQQQSTFDGSISVRGGFQKGNGGLAEVSGKGDLAFAGTTDAGAPAGKNGALLLDPKNLIISAAPAGVFPQFDLIDPHPTAGGDFGSQVTVLGNGNVVVTNLKDNFGGNGTGAVYLFDGLSGALISSLVGSNQGDYLGYDGVIPLSKGNYVVESSYWNGQRGAVTWGNGLTGVSGVVSSANSLTGSNPGDLVGHYGAIPLSSGNPRDVVGHYGVIPLSDGNYVIESPYWSGNRGAVTWGSGSTGVSGTVSEANSLIGSNPGDYVGSYQLGLSSLITALSDGNYVIESPYWSGSRGAVTWGNGSTGVSGAISTANSLTGSNPADQVGFLGTTYQGIDLEGVYFLSSGNYVIDSPYWSGGRGAVTWGSSSTGISGAVSATNSLIGSNPWDYVGGGGVTPLSNGNYVVKSPNWNVNRGAVTWENGSSGISGTVSTANSLTGSKPTDEVGFAGGVASVTPLTNGNYVVDSLNWNGDRGAVTWGNGNTGVSGTISAANSLTDSNPTDYVGDGGVTPLSNGNYVIESPDWGGNREAVTWENGSRGLSGTITAANSLIDINGFSPQFRVGITPLSNGNYVVPSYYGGLGAVTWGNGSTGTSGIISSANSLTGSNQGDLLGFNSNITPLSNGNYVVASPTWNHARGAVTWSDGNTGVSGTISAANSLIGSNTGDAVGAVIPLSNGNYVIDSSSWNGYRGAVTSGNGSMGVTGVVSSANSLTGSNPGDQVGFANALGSVGGPLKGIFLLSNGNYVVDSPYWNGNRGAVTWENGSTEVSGVVSSANSLTGSDPKDYVGYSGIAALSNGNYVVNSPTWNSYRGAVTWGNGNTGVSGTVSAVNSLTGRNPLDLLGTYGGATPLNNGNYVVYTPGWNNARGALTWESGLSGQTLDGSNTITPQNSLVGSVPNAGLGNVIENPVDNTFLASFLREGGGGLRAGFTDPGQLVYAVGQSQSISITPGFLTRTLNSGTAVVLQASNDITVNSPITVNAGGQGGPLTLQAGRSILLNAPITTDTGALVLIANDQLANGVVDSERDPGNAVISMAPGTALDTGSGALTVELRDGAGLTNRDSGAISLKKVTAGSVWVSNDGPSASSDVQVDEVATSGSQYYADPNGTTYVTGNLTAADSSIRFVDSVVVNDGVRVTAGADAVFFAGNGTQTLHSGSGTVFGDVNHSGTGTLRLQGSLTITGSFINAAGIFDANNQAVSVGGAAAIFAGTYLAGTGPQTFQSGLAIAQGVFTSSSGPMMVTGGIRLLGGSLGGSGTVDSVAAEAGTVAPGGDSPGVLVVSNSATFSPATTFSSLLEGPDPGTGYAQLRAGGSVSLGGSALNLNVGFAPPVGSSFAIITTTNAAPISGTFQGLSEGTIFTQNGFQFRITYQGGTDGKSVVLTRLA